MCYHLDIFVLLTDITTGPNRRDNSVVSEIVRSIAAGMNGTLCVTVPLGSPKLILDCVALATLSR